MTESEIKSIAIKRCTDAGYKDGTSNFTNCVFEESRIGASASKKGKFKEWAKSSYGKAGDWVEKQGGFWNTLDSIGSIANKVKGWKQQSGSPSDYDIGLENSSNSRPISAEEQKKKNTIMWVIISIVLVALIVAFILIMRKKNKS